MGKVFLSLAAFSTLLMADVTMTFKGQDFDQTFYYRDDQHAHIVIEADDGRSELFVIGDHAYTLTDHNGEKIYYDVDEMREQMRRYGVSAMLSQKAKDARDEADIRVIKKGKSVEVAGIDGELWTIRYRDPMNGETTEEAVVTDDDDVVEAMGAWGRMMERAMPTEGEMGMETIMQVEAGHVVIKVKDFELAGFDEGRISASHFQLPKDAKKQQIGNANAQEPTEEERAAVRGIMSAPDGYPEEEEMGDASDHDAPAGTDEPSDADRAIEEGMNMLKSLF